MIKGKFSFIRYKNDPPIRTNTDARPPIKLIIPLALLLRGAGVISGIKATVGALKIAIEKLRTVIIIIRLMKLV